MKDEYNFSNADAKPNPFAERIRKEGMTITEVSSDGSRRSKHFPPGTLPCRARAIHVYKVKRGWVVRTEGASRAFRLTNSEQSATMIGRELARKRRADLVVHFAG